MKFKTIEVATSDERGNISDIFVNQQWQHVAIINTPNASEENPVIRGNHFHKRSEQSIYVISGKLKYWYKSPEETHAHYIDVSAGSCVYTPSLEIHALEIKEPTTFMAFANGIRGGDDYESDTFRTESIIPHLRESYE